MRPALKSDPAAPPAEPEAAAAYWSARRRLGLNDAADEAAFAAWRADPRHARAFEAVEASVEAYGALADDPEVARLRRRALRVAGRRRRWIWSALLLASLGLAAALIADVLTKL